MKPKMNLYFKHWNGKYDIVKYGINEEDVYDLINEFCHKLNPKYKIYYIRTHISYGNNKEGKPTPIVNYDVGSHTEFFFLTEMKYREFVKGMKDEQ